MAKRAGRVGFGLSQSGRGSKRVTGQNGSFLNRLIGLRVKQVWPILPCLIISARFGRSWGPLTWIVPSEILPLEVKPVGQGICIASNFLLTFILSQAFLSILCKMKFGVFLFYAEWVLIMTVFVGLFLPETKGLPLQEMDKIWLDHWFLYRFVEVPSSNYANMVKFNKLLQNFLCDSTAGTRGVSYYFHFDTAGIIINQDIHFDLWEVKQNSSVWSMIWLLLYRGVRSQLDWPFFLLLNRNHVLALLTK